MCAAWYVHKGVGCCVCVCVWDTAEHAANGTRTSRHGKHQGQKLLHQKTFLFSRGREHGLLDSLTRAPAFHGDVLWDGRACTCRVIVLDIPSSKLCMVHHCCRWGIFDKVADFGASFFRMEHVQHNDVLEQRRRSDQSSVAW